MTSEGRYEFTFPKNAADKVLVELNPFSINQEVKQLIAQIKEALKQFSMIPHFAYAVFIQIQSLYYAIGQQIGESSDKADKEQLEEARKLLSDYCRERFGSDLITYRPYRDPGSENR